MDHVRAVCTDPDCGGSCPYCCLFVCAVCGEYEAGLAPECPGPLVIVKEEVS